MVSLVGPITGSVKLTTIPCNAAPFLQSSVVRDKQTSSYVCCAVKRTIAQGVAAC